MADDRPNLLFFPPLGFAVAVALSVVLQWLAPLGLMPPRFTGWALALGLALIAAALGLALWGERTFKRAGTHVNPQRPALALVEDGPYRFTRNPMYLGMVLFLVGLGFAFALDWALPLAVALWAALHFGVVLREEAYLAAKFGDPYRVFIGRTRRWL